MIIKWIIIGVLVIVGLWYLRMEHHTRKVKAIVIVIIVALLYFSMMSIFSSENVDMTSPRGIVRGVYVYFGWIGNTASNLWEIGTDTVRTVGNAIRVDNNEDKKDQPRARLLSAEK